MRLYLAGPDVFFPDALARAELARTRCAAHGHDALVPLDNEATTAPDIYRANIALIARADAVLANLNPFRGQEPDSGTVFEVGYALALGKPVIGYLDDLRPQAEKLAERLNGGAPLPRRDGRPVDGNGVFVEDFGLPLNLMLGIPVRLVAGDLDAALTALPALLAARHD